MPVIILDDPTTMHKCPDTDTYFVYFDYAGNKGWYTTSGIIRIKYCPYCGEGLDKAKEEAKNVK